MREKYVYVVFNPHFACWQSCLKRHHSLRMFSKSRQWTAYRIQAMMETTKQPWPSWWVCWKLTLDWVDLLTLMTFPGRYDAVPQCALLLGAHWKYSSHSCSGPWRLVLEHGSRAEVVCFNCCLNCKAVVVQIHKVLKWWFQFQISVIWDCSSPPPFPTLSDLWKCLPFACFDISF